MLLGAFVSAGAAFWNTHRQHRRSEDAAAERARFERELRAKSDEIADLNRTIAASVTGGESYAYINLFPGREGAVINGGKFPLYDVSIRIVDVDRLNAAAETVPPAEAFARSQVVLSVGNIGANQAAMTAAWPESSGDRLNLNVFIGARNGFVTELVRLRRIDGLWKRAMKVTRDVDQSILLEEVDPQYPRNAKGEVDWGS